MIPGDERQPVEILMVEDNQDDVDLALETLREIDVSFTLRSVSNGVEALAYLRREGKYADAARPQLILLDLNLPRKDGREVLAEIKADERLRRIPVIVLSTSQAEMDVLRAYDLHANCYIAKPLQLEQFISTMEAIQQFWLNTVRLPQE